VNDWDRNLPDGVHLTSRDRSGFKLGVSLPVDATGMWPMKCPVEPEHRFKMVITQSTEKASTDKVFCPYCGHEDAGWKFAPEQLARVRQAGLAAAEQFAHHEVAKMLQRSFGGRSSGLVRIKVNPGSVPRRRQLPTYEIEETRRSMRCQRCAEAFAVYGLAIYCPGCGQLAPAQQFQEIIRAHRERLESLHGLPADVLRALRENGALTLSYESTVKDGFGALETYLRQRFVALSPEPIKTARGAFQRLDDASTLYEHHLGVDLVAAAGESCWHALRRTASIRHVLVHNAGVVDEAFLAQQPGWHQLVGQKIHVDDAEATAFLDALEHLLLATQAVAEHPEAR